jgi:hypothetical protein
MVNIMGQNWKNKKHYGLNRKIGVVAASNSSIYALTRQRGERKRKRRWLSYWRIAPPPFLHTSDLNLRSFFLFDFDFYLYFRSFHVYEFIYLLLYRRHRTPSLFRVADSMLNLVLARKLSLSLSLSPSLIIFQFPLLFCLRVFLVCVFDLVRCWNLLV